MALELYGLTCEYQEKAMGVARQNAVFGWKLRSATPGARQTAYRIVVCDEQDRLIWDSQKVCSEQQFGIEMCADTVLRPLSEYTFSVTVWDDTDAPSATVRSRFVTGVFRVHQWPGQWFRVWQFGAVHFYRHEFEVGDLSEVRYAYAYIASRGEKMNANVTYLNGVRIGNSVNFPGATEYFRAFYSCVDVKEQLRAGRNALGLVATTTSSLVLKIAYRDGTEQVVSAARDTWRSTIRGPYVKLGYDKADLRGKAEEYDARLEYVGWTLPGYDDSRWEIGKRDLTIDFGPLFLQPQFCSVVVQERRRPVRILKRDQWVLVDFGVNMTGFVSLRLQGTPGKTVEVRYSEKLTEDGQGCVIPGWCPCYTKYTFSTDGVEEYTPSFMHTGFRCVELHGYSGEITEDSVVAVSMHSDVLDATAFACSDPLIEQLNTVARRSFLCNLVNIPTDCPERERRGWTADAYAVCQAECVNFNVLTFYRQWLESMRDCQRGNGWIPVELPLSTDDCIDVNWPAAAVLVPYNLYEQYADTDLVREFYPMMCHWVELLERICDDEYAMCDAFLSYKDWFAADPASGVYLSMAYFYRCTDLLGRMAGVLGRMQERARWSALAAEVGASINRRYLHCEAGRVWYDTGSQSADAHALYFDICPPEHRAALTAHLVQDIERKQTSTTGFMGTMCLLQALSENGRPDVAYRLLKNRNMGGWLYLIERCGATTFPEHYNGGGSQNHAFLGSAPGLWIYKYLVGIQPAAPGYRRVRICPYIPEDIAHAAATVDTLYGPVSAEWETTEAGQTLQVCLPPGVTGTVYWKGEEHPVVSGTTVLPNNRP